MTKAPQFIIAAKDNLIKNTKIDHKELDKISQNIKTITSANGYCIVRNLGLIHFDTIENKKRKLYKIISSLGIPTQHNNTNTLNSIFWDIKFRGNKYNQENETTFSEQLSACDFHSDPSFSIKPEDYLIMYVVNPANNGGESLYLKFDSLLKTLN